MSRNITGGKLKLVSVGDDKVLWEKELSSDEMNNMLGIEEGIIYEEDEEIKFK